MHVWRMNAICLCLLACACASRPADDVGSSTAEADAGSTETSTSSGVETGAETETAAPCEVEDCDGFCDWSVDECEQPEVPACSPEGECICVQETPCPPCDERECGRWERCSGDGIGWCEVDICGGDGPLWLDPADSCEVPTPGLPPELVDIASIEVDGLSYRDVDDCANEEPGGSWVWAVEGELILLCDTLCSTFAAGETTRLTWGIPCE